MDTKKAFEESGRLGNEVTKLRRELEHVNMNILKIMDECPHEIVFKYHDPTPRMLAFDSRCFCPACGKTLNFLSINDIEKTEFRNARVIPLLHLAPSLRSESYRAIREEVYTNMDLYYDPNSDIEELSTRVDNILRNMQAERAAKIIMLKRNARGKH